MAPACSAYEGVCIGRSGGGLIETFTVRKISYGEGVERVFPGNVANDQLGAEGGTPRQGPPRQALLPAQPARQVSPSSRRPSAPPPSRVVWSATGLTEGKRGLRSVPFLSRHCERINPPDVADHFSSFRGAPLGASPEWYFPIVVIDSGPAPSGASRNDGCGAIAYRSSAACAIWPMFQHSPAHRVPRRSLTTQLALALVSAA